MLREVFVILCAAFLLPVRLTAGQTDDFINWSADRKLQWQDYRAEPDTRSGAAASTSTQIGFEYHIRDNKPEYIITCKFSKTKSWGRYKNDYILSHEQGHFDIAEIFTRKLVKALRDYSFNINNYRNDLRKLYTDAMNQKERFQQQYDRETDYSRVKEKQDEWLKKIRDELLALDDYADY